MVLKYLETILEHYFKGGNECPSLKQSSGDYRLMPRIPYFWKCSPFWILCYPASACYGAGFRVAVESFLKGSLRISGPNLVSTYLDHPLHSTALL